MEHGTQNMELTIEKILSKTIHQNPISISPIKNLGSVNQVFDVKTSSGNYIFRLNDEESKRIEFLKEKYCIDQARALQIPSPEVLVPSSPTEQD